MEKKVSRLAWWGGAKWRRALKGKCKKLVFEVEEIYEGKGAAEGFFVVRMMSQDNDFNNRYSNGLEGC